MSSTITESERQTLPQENQHFLNDKKPGKLTRSISIDKMNAYICSQNYYYFINSILFWLKTSQTILQKTIETCIYHVKSFWCNTIVYKILEIIFINLLKYEAVCKNLARIAVEQTKAKTNKIVHKSQNKLMAIVYYLGLIAIFSQFFVIIYFLSGTWPPLGFVFLLTCLYLIIQVQYQIIHFYWTRKPKGELRPSRAEQVRRSTVIVKPREILGKRTISNLQLF